MTTKPFIHAIDINFQKYPEIDKTMKQASFEFYCFLAHRKQNYQTYLLSLGIPVYCVANICSKLIVDTCRIVEIIIQSIKEQRYAGGNIFTLIVDLAEYCRNIFGAVLGLPIALIFSPKKAAELFLMPESGQAKTLLSPVEGAHLYAMAHKLHAFFAKHRIDYRICSGTALGALRDGGVIRHDDDIDVIIHPESVTKLVELIDNGTFSAATGITIEVQPLTGGWQCFYQENPKGKKGTPTEKIGMPFCDIFKGAFRPKGDERIITFLEDKMYYQSPGDYFTEDEWNSERLYDFGPTKLIGIDDEAMVNYLKRCYGYLVLEYITMLYPHEVYSDLYAKPYSFFSIPRSHHTPRYLRHTNPNPLAYDEQTYLTKLTFLRHSYEAESGDLDQTQQLVLPINDKKTYQNRLSILRCSYQAESGDLDLTQQSATLAMV